MNQDRLIKARTMRHAKLLMPSLRCCHALGRWLERGPLTGGCSATGAPRSLPSLRTDSVNRGCCISLLTLATVVLAGSLELLLFFFIIPQY
jgi:hypothetical protein